MRSMLHTGEVVFRHLHGWVNEPWGFQRIFLFRRLVVSSAKGEESEELIQVKNAWYAVGVEETQNGVDVENITMLNIYSADNKLMVETVAGNNIEVYNTLGQLIVSVESQIGITTIPVALENSVVIVKVGNAIEKVLVK